MNKLILKHIVSGIIATLLLGIFTSGCRASDSDSGRTDYAANTEREEKDDDGMIAIDISVGDQVFRAEFYNNDAAAAIISEMPFALDMDDYASQEKVTDLPFAVPSISTEVPAVIHSGDIYLWSGNSLVLFYTTFSNTYSYVPIGVVLDVDELGNVLRDGSVQVTFNRADTY